MKSKKKICFLGSRLETLKLLKIFFDVSKIITTKDSYIQKNNFKCIIINKKNKEIIFKKLMSSKEKIIVSAGFPYHIPVKVINKFKFALNCHPGKLPKYKGYYSIDDAIRNKEIYIYSTIHNLNHKIDSGKKIFELKLKRKKIHDDELKKTLFSIVEPFALFQALQKIKLI